MRAPRNLARYRAAAELRRSNAAAPIPSGKRYRRNPKHRDTITRKCVE